MKVVVITGSSFGLGLELANFLATKEYKVYGIARSEVSSDKFTSLIGDVTKYEELENIFKEIIKTEGKIDILINNAGMGISGSIEASSISDIENIFDVNFKGVVLTSKLVLPYMRKQKYGRIINIGSVASEFSIPFQGFYSSSKAAVKTFSEALNNEVSIYGINVCTILPGDIKTSFTKNRKKNKQELDVYSKRVEKSIGLMEKDEQNGMSTTYASKKIYEIIKKKKLPIQKTIGNKYKTFIFVKRFLPYRFINYVVGKIYGFKKIK